MGSVRTQRMRWPVLTRTQPSSGPVAGAHGGRIAVEVSRSSEGWDVALPGSEQPITCETLDDARRVAYLYGAHAGPCELIVREGRDRVHSELIGIASGS
jgi:hypothetical protein